MQTIYDQYLTRGEKPSDMFGRLAKSMAEELGMPVGDYIETVRGEKLPEPDLLATLSAIHKTVEQWLGENADNIVRQAKNDYCITLHPEHNLWSISIERWRVNCGYMNNVVGEYILQSRWSLMYCIQSFLSTQLKLKTRGK